MDLRTVIVRPLHRNLRRPQLEFVGKKQQLWIESPALNSLTREHRLNRPQVEGLKAALRVAKPQPQHYSQPQIEQPPIQLPKQWLPLGLQFALQPARPNRYVRSFAQRREQLIGFRDRRGKIGVGKQRDLSPGVQ